MRSTTDRKWFSKHFVREGSLPISQSKAGQSFKQRLLLEDLGNITLKESLNITGELCLLYFASSLAPYFSCSLDQPGLFLLAVLPTQWFPMGPRITVRMYYWSPCFSSSESKISRVSCLWCLMLILYAIKMFFINSISIGTPPHLQRPPEGHSSCAAPPQLHQTPFPPSSPVHSLKHHIISCTALTASN